MSRSYRPTLAERQYGANRLRGRKQRLDALYREVAADVATNIAGTPLLFVTNIRHVLPTQTLLGSASFIGDLEDPYVYYDRVKHSAPNVGIHMLPIREVHP